MRSIRMQVRGIQGVFLSQVHQKLEKSNAHRHTMQVEHGIEVMPKSCPDHPLLFLLFLFRTCP
jgi:hypothetical protein